MSFISYAQNFEDVMLWRALKHVQNGMYVDVGAQHPVIDSVSKAFYDRGWKGIHIEPVLEYAELLRQHRPDEMVLQIALADVEGILELYVIPNTGLTTAVKSFADRHHNDHGFEHQLIHVPVLTLKSALLSLADKDIHWLKIDVEGFEENVLKGWDSQALRPWIMVIEATIPNSPKTNYESWEPILSAANYQFVYFDGLNRFYVAKEHAELASAFSCPPNFFDNVYLTANSELTRTLVASHEADKSQMLCHAQKLQNEINTTNQHLMQIDAELKIAQEHKIHMLAHNERLQNEAAITNQHLIQIGAELQTGQENETHMQAQIKKLQNEADTANQHLMQRDAELKTAQDHEIHMQTEIANLKNEAGSEIQCPVQLSAELKTTQEHERHMQAQINHLQNEWETCKDKINELNYHSHYWWTATETLKQQLQSVHSSTSWKITWFLRKTKSTIQQASNLSACVLLKLQNKLKSAVTTNTVIEVEVPVFLPPRVARIYAELEKANKTRKNQCV